MLPKPTADPAAAIMNPILLAHWARFSVGADIEMV
jgi:hypothetical protein